MPQPKALPRWPAPRREDALALLGFVVLVALGVSIWDVVVRADLVSPLVPAPGNVANETLAALRDPFYVRGTNSVGIGWHLLASLWRVLIGCALAAVVAIPLGFLIGNSETVAKMLDPFVHVLRPVSPLAWLPIGLALLRDSQHTAIFIIFMSSLWPMLLTTALGVRTVPKPYRALARTLQAGSFTTARRVLLPAALPSIFTGVRLSLGTGWLVIVAAEMLIGGRGIGYYIWNKWNNLDIAGIAVAIVLIGLTGLLLDRGLHWLEGRMSYD